MTNHYNQELFFKQFDNFTLSIYVIGYKGQGESILILLNENDPNSLVPEVKYSILIDCYKTESLNLVEDLLTKYNISNLDIICWSHPHIDHSKGLDEIVKKHTTENTIFFSPKFYAGKKISDLLGGDSEACSDIFGHIHQHYEDNFKNNIAHNWRTISANGDYSNVYSILLSTLEEKKDFSIYFLTPMSYLTDDLYYTSKETKDPNDLSISFLISIDGYNFFLGGDITNKHARNIKPEIIKSTNWIKIPHHCSKTSDFISEHIGERLRLACSTVYTPSNLPNKEIQERYLNKNRTRLFMTQLEQEDLLAEYGIIRFDYKFGRDDINIDITTEGNAGEYTTHE